MYSLAAIALLLSLKLPETEANICFRDFQSYAGNHGSCASAMGGRHREMGVFIRSYRSCCRRLYAQAWGFPHACQSCAAIRGVVSAWNNWSPCSRSCGLGKQQRRRVCSNHVCAGMKTQKVTQTRQCTWSPCCPVDGQWSTWSESTGCTVSCGIGIEFRSRLCNSPQPQCGGKRCPGPARQYKECYASNCQEPTWGEWAASSPCSATCGDGMRSRFRQCHHGDFCEGPGEDRVPCNEKPCPGRANWCPWSEWGACSATCGSERGTRSRTRRCACPAAHPHTGEPCRGSSLETAFCNATEACPVDGGWGNWTLWSRCSSIPCSTQIGYQFRMRACDNPPPSHSGAQCEGRSHIRRRCIDMDGCQVEGLYGQWGSWSQCSATCGECGSRTRTRECMSPFARPEEWNVDIVAGEPRLLCNAERARESQACKLQQCPDGSNPCGVAAVPDFYHLSRHHGLDSLNGNAINGGTLKGHASILGVVGSIAESQKMPPANYINGQDKMEHASTVKPMPTTKKTTAKTEKSKSRTKMDQPSTVLLESTSENTMPVTETLVSLTEVENTRTLKPASTTRKTKTTKEKSISRTEMDQLTTTMPVSQTRKTIFITKKLVSPTATEMKHTSTTRSSSTTGKKMSTEKSVSPTEMDTSTDNPASTREMPISKTEKLASHIEMEHTSTERTMPKKEKSTTKVKLSTNAVKPSSTTEKTMFATEKTISTAEMDYASTAKPASTTEKMISKTQKLVSSTEMGHTSTAMPASTTGKTISTAEMEHTSTQKPASTTKKSISITEKLVHPTEIEHISTATPAATTDKTMSTTYKSVSPTEMEHTGTVMLASATEETISTTKKLNSSKELERTTTVRPPSTTEETMSTTEMLVSLIEHISSVKSASTTEKTISATEKTISTAEMEHTSTTKPASTTKKSISKTGNLVSSTEFEHTNTAVPTSTTEKTISTSGKIISPTEMEQTNTVMPASTTEKTIYTTKKLIHSTKLAHRTTVKPPSTTEETMSTTEMLVSPTEIKNISSAKSVSTTEKTISTIEKLVTPREMEHTSTAKPASRTEKPIYTTDKFVFPTETQHTRTVMPESTTKKVMPTKEKLVFPTETQYNRTVMPESTIEKTISTTEKLISSKETEHASTVEQASTTRRMLSSKEKPVSPTEMELTSTVKLMSTTENPMPYTEEPVSIGSHQFATIKPIRVQGDLTTGMDESWDTDEETSVLYTTFLKTRQRLAFIRPNAVVTTPFLNTESPYKATSHSVSNQRQTLGTSSRPMGYRTSSGTTGTESALDYTTRRTKLETKAIRSSRPQTERTLHGARPGEVSGNFETSKPLLATETVLMPTYDKTNADKPFTSATTEQKSLPTQFAELIVPQVHPATTDFSKIPDHIVSFESDRSTNPRADSPTYPSATSSQIRIAKIEGVEAPSISIINGGNLFDIQPATSASNWRIKTPKKAISHEFRDANHQTASVREEEDAYVAVGIRETELDAEDLETKTRTREIRSIRPPLVDEFTYTASAKPDARLTFPDKRTAHQHMEEIGQMLTTVPVQSGTATQRKTISTDTSSYAPSSSTRSYKAEPSTLPTPQSESVPAFKTQFDGKVATPEGKVDPSSFPSSERSTALNEPMSITLEYKQKTVEQSIEESLPPRVPPDEREATKAPFSNEVSRSRIILEGTTSPEQYLQTTDTTRTNPGTEDDGDMESSRTYSKKQASAYTQYQETTYSDLQSPVATRPPPSNPPRNSAFTSDFANRIDSASSHTAGKATAPDVVNTFTAKPYAQLRKGNSETTTAGYAGSSDEQSPKHAGVGLNGGKWPETTRAQTIFNKPVGQEKAGTSHRSEVKYKKVFVTVVTVATYEVFTPLTPDSDATNEERNLLSEYTMKFEGDTTQQDSLNAQALFARNSSGPNLELCILDNSPTTPPVTQPPLYDDLSVFSFNRIPKREDTLAFTDRPLHVVHRSDYEETAHINGQIPPSYPFYDSAVGAEFDSSGLPPSPNNLLESYGHSEANGDTLNGGRDYSYLDSILFQDDQVRKSDETKQTADKPAVKAEDDGSLREQMRIDFLLPVKGQKVLPAEKSKPSATSEQTGVPIKSDDLRIRPAAATSTTPLQTTATPADDTIHPQVYGGDEASSVESDYVGLNGDDHSMGVDMFGLDVHSLGHRTLFHPTDNVDPFSFPLPVDRNEELELGAALDDGNMDFASDSDHSASGDSEEYSLSYHEPEYSEDYHASETTASPTTTSLPKLQASSSSTLCQELPRTPELARCCEVVNDTYGGDESAMSSCLSILFKNEFGYDDDVDMEEWIAPRGTTRCMCRRNSAYMKTLCCRRPTCGHWKKALFRSLCNVCKPFCKPCFRPVLGR